MQEQAHLQGINHLNKVLLQEQEIQLKVPLKILAHHPNQFQNQEADHWVLKTGKEQC